MPLLIDHCAFDGFPPSLLTPASWIVYRLIKFADEIGEDLKEVQGRVSTLRSIGGGYVAYSLYNEGRIQVLDATKSGQSAGGEFVYLTK